MLLKFQDQMIYNLKDMLKMYSNSSTNTNNNVI